jgi:hypothetical protein
MPADGVPQGDTFDIVVHEIGHQLVQIILFA